MFLKRTKKDPSARKGIGRKKLIWIIIATLAVGSSITIGFGGSVGAEAPIVLTGSAIGSNLGKFFKMDQKRPWFQSSVPSDRFYDDFDLRFDPLGQDGEHPLLYYYSLRADSPQHIGCDIYSARIKAPEMPGMTKYEAIAGYLEKVVKEKSSPRPIDNIVYFAGHGYNSESIQARIDETVELNDHFKGFGGRISFVNYDRDPFVKERFQALLEDPDIDIALCHHHGAEDTQYLSATPYTGTIGGYIDCLRMSVRTKCQEKRYR